MLTTARLRLRRWRAEDLEPFAALNADPRVRAFFPSVQTHQESADSMAFIRDHFEQRGFGLWAVDVIGRAAVHRLHRSLGAIVRRSVHAVRRAWIPARL